MTDVKPGTPLPCPWCDYEMIVFNAFPKVEDGWIIEGDHDETCPLVGFSGERQCYFSRDIALTAWNARVSVHTGPANQARIAALEAALGEARKLLEVAFGASPPDFRKGSLASRLGNLNIRIDALLAGGGE